MPGPPPPSKSYLLKFDSFSDEDSDVDSLVSSSSSSSSCCPRHDDDQHHPNDGNRTISTNAATNSTTSHAVSGGTTRSTGSSSSTGGTSAGGGNGMGQASSSRVVPTIPTVSKRSANKSDVPCYSSSSAFTTTACSTAEQTSENVDCCSNKNTSTSAATTGGLLQVLAKCSTSIGKCTPPFQSQRHQQQQQQQQQEEEEKKHNSVVTVVDSTTRMNEEYIDNDSGNTKDKKKKKKKKKRKTKKGGPSSSSSSTKPKKVTFTNIQVSEFHRDIHGDGVPSDGGWPLALSNQLYRSFHVDVDDFETKKQVELRKRYEQYVVARRRKKARALMSHKADGNNASHNHNSSSSSSNSSSGSSSRRKRSNSKVGEEEMKHAAHHHEISNNSAILKAQVYIPENYAFETRQYDYKERGPDRYHQDGVHDAKLEWEEIRSTGKNVLFGQLSESERKDLLLRDVLRVTDKHRERQEDKSSPSSSSSSTMKKNSHRKDSLSDNHEIYSSLDLQHVRHELEQIRIQRATESAAGCSCRKLHVVLVDELNEGHKKKSHHHRRLTERKVKEELRKRHVAFPHDAKREELEKLLHDEVEKHGCCYGNDCPCVKSGIGCQSDTCSCWHMSHMAVSHKKSGDKVETANPVEAQQRCGNKNGIYVVDFTAIQKHRDQFITARESKLCGVISG